MSFLEILTMVRELTTAFKVHDWAKVATLIAEFIGKMLQGKTSLTTGSTTTEDSATINAALDEMVAAADSHS